MSLVFFRWIISLFFVELPLRSELHNFGTLSEFFVVCGVVVLLSDSVGLSFDLIVELFLQFKFCSFEFIPFLSNSKVECVVVLIILIFWFRS